MLLGIDCSTPITKEIAEKLFKEGFRFVMRYLMTEYYGRKRLTIEEARIISDAGLKIGTCFESYAERAGEGAAAGAEDGATEFRLALEFNIPTDAILYFAVDFDAEESDMDAIEAYLRAAREQTGPYEIGVYGEYEVLEEMGKRGVCKGHWQTYAWSGGKESFYMNIYQYSNGETAAGITVDFNIAESDVGLWSYPPTVSGQALELTALEAKQIVQNKAGLSYETIQYIADDYRYGDELIIKLAKAMEGK